MSAFKINGPFPRDFITRRGNKATVKGKSSIEGGYPFYGHIYAENTLRARWVENGEYREGYMSVWDIIGPWVEPGPQVNPYPENFIGLALITSKYDFNY